MVTAVERLAGLAAVALLAGIAGCSTSSPGPAASSGGLPLPEGSRGVALAIESPDAADADTLHMTLIVFNRSARGLTLQFSSGQRYDFAIIDAAGSEVWRWSEGRVFTQALGSETIGPGAELRYVAAYVGELPAGGHTIVGELTARDHPLSATATIGDR